MWHDTMILKTLSAVAITGMIGAVAQPRLADAVGTAEMPWFAQFGLCGLFGALLWWCHAKTIPSITRDHVEATEKVCRTFESEGKQTRSEISGLRQDITSSNNSQLEFLRDCLRERDKQ